MKEQLEVGDLKGYDKIIGQPSIFSYTYLQSINPQNTLDTHPKSTSCLVTGVHRLKKDCPDLIKDGSACILNLPILQCFDLFWNSLL